MTQYILQHGAEPPAPGEACEIADGVLWLRLPLPNKPDHVNIYALRGSSGWTLVDTGMNWDGCREAWDLALAGPLAGLPVEQVIVTHHHPDHIGCAGLFAAKGAPLVATRTAYIFARMLTLDVQEVPTDEAIAFWTRAGMPPEMRAARASKRPFNFADIVLPLPVGFRRIQEGDTLRIGGRDWTVHIGHGHAPEHATLWCEADEIVLAGDQVLPGISPNLGVYPTEPLADPVGEWIASCKRLRRIAGEGDWLVLPGHKRPFRGLGARLEQLVENHENALTRLRDWLSEPRTAVECFAALYRREINDSEYGLAMAEAVGHLNHFARTGVAHGEEDREGRILWRLNL